LGDQKKKKLQAGPTFKKRGGLENGHSSGLERFSSGQHVVEGTLCTAKEKDGAKTAFDGRKVGERPPAPWGYNVCKRIVRTGLGSRRFV